MVLNEYIVEKRDNMRGGEGQVTIENWAGAETLPPHVRFSATMIFPPGASIGEHVHEGEAEIFHVVSGAGEYNDNGSAVPVKQGSVMVNYDGQKHCIRNTGSEDLVIAALIVTNEA
jgi:mannose-6-phosphate isomerase-like protein (cupin superfamily)